MFTLRDNLPEILRDKIPEDQTSWTSFVKAIKANQNNPFGSGGGQGNLFNQGQPNRRPMFTPQPQQRNLEEETKIIKDSIALYPLQPITEEGLKVYREQMNAWHQRNGNVQPTKTTGFPLRPGGAQPGSGECYKCGITGHRGLDCNLGNMIPKFEGNFRAICGSILNPHRPPIQVNLVTAETDEFPWANGVFNSSQQQGNGEGPSAY